MSLRVLIFGTTYFATIERLNLARQWATLHRIRNLDCSLLMVDSASPLRSEFANAPMMESFPDNIGHLSHGGRDGWGRAFCHGLNRAIEGGFDYVAHIEGDSLFRLPAMAIARRMQQDGIKVASVPIGYGEAQRSAWVETGLMFFDVAYLKTSDFIAGYDWPNRTARPQPEIVIRKMLGSDLTMMPWKAERSDKGEITLDNVHEFDWITHCKPEVYDRFVESVLEHA